MSKDQKQNQNQSQNQNKPSSPRPSINQQSEKRNGYNPPNPNKGVLRPMPKG